MPNFGHWLNREPLQEQGGINLYAYVNGDPLGYVDPDGRFAVVMFHPAVAIPLIYAVCRALGGCEIPNLPDWPSWQNSESVPESCADDKKLSKGEIDKLKGQGVDPHDMKPKKNGPNTIYSKIKTEIFLLSQRRVMVLESLLVSIFITCEDNMRVYARLSIMSESVSSKDISGQVGMSFDELWDIGDRRKLGSIVEKDNGCTIKSEVDSSSTIEDHLESLFMRTVDKEHSIRLLSDRGDVYIQVSLSIYSEDAPPLTFERKYINWISNIGASLDVDLYPFE